MVHYALTFIKFLVVDFDIALLLLLLHNILIYIQNEYDVMNEKNERVNINEMVYSEMVKFFIRKLNLRLTPDEL